MKAEILFSYIKLIEDYILTNTSPKITTIYKKDSVGRIVDLLTGDNTVLVEFNYKEYEYNVIPVPLKYLSFID